MTMEWLIRFILTSLGHCKQDLEVHVGCEEVKVVEGDGNARVHREEDAGSAAEPGLLVYYLRPGGIAESDGVTFPCTNRGVRLRTSVLLVIAAEKIFRLP